MCMCMCMYIYMCMCLCMCMCTVGTRVHVHVHAHVHVHVHGAWPVHGVTRAWRVRGVSLPPAACRPMVYYSPPTTYNLRRTTCDLLRLTATHNLLYCILLRAGRPGGLGGFLLRARAQLLPLGRP